MKKIEIKLKKCCLECEHFSSSGIYGLSPYSMERVISCGHMEVCWKYNTKNLDSQIPKKPVNVKKNGKEISNAECPSCRYSFPDVGGVCESYGEVEQYTFCPECGQRIDWNET